MKKAKGEMPIVDISNTEIKEMLEEAADKKVAARIVVINERFDKVDCSIESIQGDTQEIKEVLCGNAQYNKVGLTSEHNEMYDAFKIGKWVVGFLSVSSVLSMLTLVMLVRDVFFR